MKQIELDALRARGTKVKVVKSPPKPEPQRVEVKVRHEKVVFPPIDVNLKAKVDIGELAGQVAALTETVNRLIAMQLDNSRIEIVRDNRGTIVELKRITH